ncbi:MAG: hypothetical protein Q4B17_03120 [Lautropia sp.]|nr:hypothetical protein [Lautropia sp.]
MSASTSTTGVTVAAHLDVLGAWQQALLWVCVVGGVLVCAAILLATLRHQRLKGAGAPEGSTAMVSSDGEQPGSRCLRLQALLMEAIWVMVPLLIVLGLGAWVVASHLGYLR